MVCSSCAILALPKDEASSASPAELTTTGIPDDSACTDAFNLSGEWSDRGLLPLVVLFVAPGSPAGRNPEGSFGGPKSHSVGEHRPRGTRQHELREGGEVEGGLGYS